MNKIKLVSFHAFYFQKTMNQAETETEMEIVLQLIMMLAMWYFLINIAQLIATY